MYDIETQITSVLDWVVQTCLDCIKKVITWWGWWWVVVYQVIIEPPQLTLFNSVLDWVVAIKGHT